MESRWNFLKTTKLTKFNKEKWQNKPGYSKRVLKQINDNLNKYYNNNANNNGIGAYDHYRAHLLDKSDKRYHSGKSGLSDSRNCFKITHSYYNNYGYRRTTTLRNVPAHFLLNMNKFSLAKRDQKFQNALTHKFGYHLLKSGKPTQNPTFSLAKGAHAGLNIDDTSKVVHNNPYCSCNKTSQYTDGKKPFHLTYSNIREETGCPINHLQHAVSNGERITKNFLKQNGISYMYGHRMGVNGYDTHNGGRTNGRLHADFFIPHQAIGTKKDVAIEIDGSQHNYPTYLGGIQGALHQEHNARIKDLYCSNPKHNITMIRVPESAIYNGYFAKHLRNTFNKHKKRFSTGLAQKDEITQFLDKELLSKINPKNVQKASHKRTINKHHLQKLFGKKLDSKSYFLARPKQVKKGIHFFKENKQFGKDLSALSKNKPQSILNYNENLRHDESHMSLKQVYSKHFNEAKSLLRSDSYDISPENRLGFSNGALQSKILKQPHSKRSLKILAKFFKKFKNSKEQDVFDKVDNKYNKSLHTVENHNLKTRTNHPHKIPTFSQKSVDDSFKNTHSGSQIKNKGNLKKDNHQTLLNKARQEERKLTGFTR